MRDHGEGIFLRSRKILPFEILLIENCGGRDIFEKILNKQIRPCTSDTLIYQWIEATKGPAQTTSQEFLKQTNNTEDFKEKYAQELFCQQAAMPDQNIMTTIFANELEEILWKATPSILMIRRPPQPLPRTHPRRHRPLPLHSDSRSDEESGSQSSGD